MELVVVSREKNRKQLGNWCVSGWLGWIFIYIYIYIYIQTRSDNAMQLLASLYSSAISRCHASIHSELSHWTLSCQPRALASLLPEWELNIAYNITRHNNLNTWEKVGVLWLQRVKKQGTLTFFRAKKVRVPWLKCRQEQTCYSQAEIREPPPFLMTALAEKPSLQLEYMP